MTYVVIGLDGWESGPLTLEEINQALASGRFSPNCLVKESEGGRWRKAREIAGVTGSGIPVPLPGGGEGYPGSHLQALQIYELTPEQVGPFILRHAPSYKGAAGVWESLWKVREGSSTTTIFVPENPYCIMICKEAVHPLAQGAAFAINGRGWIRIPPGFIARMVKASKPLPEAAQQCLDRLYERLSGNLYLEGEACGLVKFTNGAGLRMDIKMQRDSLALVLYKVTFLGKGSFSDREYDPSGDCPLPEDTSIQTIHHGAARADGWHAFFLLQRDIPDTRGY